MEEGIVDATAVVLRREAADDQATQNAAELRHVATVFLQAIGLQSTDLRDQRHTRQQHAMLSIAQQLNCNFLIGLHQLRHLLHDPATWCSRHAYIKGDA